LLIAGAPGAAVTSAGTEIAHVLAKLDFKLTKIARRIAREETRSLIHPQAHWDLRPAVSQRRWT
jgi:hypothetical protein